MENKYNLQNENPFKDPNEPNVPEPTIPEPSPEPIPKLPPDA